MARKNEAVSEAAINAASNKAVAEGERARKQFAKSLKEQEYVPVQISPLYQPYFGKVHTVTINGASVAVPVDGKTYMIPETFAEEVAIRIYNQDQLIQKKNRLSDVTNNVESSPGELHIF